MTEETDKSGEIVARLRTGADNIQTVLDFAGRDRLPQSIRDAFTTTVALLGEAANALAFDEAGWTNIGALASRWPEGFIVLDVAQGRTPSTVDSAPEGYQDITDAVFHGVDLGAVEAFMAEMRGDREWLSDRLSRVPCGCFQAIVIVRWRQVPSGEIVAGGEWDFEFWEHADRRPRFHDMDQPAHVCAGCIGAGPCESEEDVTEDERFASMPCAGCGAAGNDDCAALCTERIGVERLNEANAPCARCGLAERDHVCFVGGEG